MKPGEQLVDLIFALKSAQQERDRKTSQVNIAAEQGSVDAIAEEIEGVLREICNGKQ